MTRQWLKLTAYFGERERTAGRFLAEDLLTLYGDRAVATSVMLRGIASFGPRKQLRSDEWLSLSEDPPVAVAAVDTRDKITSLADEVVAMTPRGLITLERAQLVTDDIANFAVTQDAKLTVYVGRRQRVSVLMHHFHILKFFPDTIFTVFIFTHIVGDAVKPGAKTLVGIKQFFFMDQFYK